MANVNDNQDSSRSQQERILAWLRSGRKITQLEALNKFGCMRLASRISDLKKAGYPIKMMKILTMTGKYVAQYSMEI